ncbi:MAG: hypothetical protein VB055_05880 [Oscillospiraceae bacterium]|nr:hypothetical protein [Oscillospiraceae bacterium]
MADDMTYQIENKCYRVTRSFSNIRLDEVLFLEISGNPALNYLMTGETKHGILDAEARMWERLGGVQ